MTIFDSRVNISQLAITDISMVVSLTEREKQELLNLQKTSYPCFTKEHVSNHTSYIDNLYIYRMMINETLVASRQFMIVNDSAPPPAWAMDLSSSLKHKRFAVDSRAIVHPSLQGVGLGSALVKNVNKFIFKHFDVDAIFGSSTNLRAIALYQKHNAQIWEPDLYKQFSGLSSLQMNTYNFTPAIKYKIPSRLPEPIRYYYSSKRSSNVL